MHENTFKYCQNNESMMLMKQRIDVEDNERNINIKIK